MTILKKGIPYFTSVCLMVALVFLLGCKSKDKEQPQREVVNVPNTNSEPISFTYDEVKGIGRDSLFNRRDNSDIIKVEDTYYVWYSRMDSPTTAGYWATIWYATSKDEGYTWEEQGMALDVGRADSFDHTAVFTPNILVRNEKYYLYYTGVRPTQGNSEGLFENNSKNDFTAIGLAVADSPDGPFKRVKNNPVLNISDSAEDFDSYRIDDASLMIKDAKIWLYYKGRSLSHGENGPGFTEMGVAYADIPEGPFVKHDGSLLDKSHEVLIWKKNKGVASLASIGKSINYAKDGVHFSAIQNNLTQIPKAPGLYRPHLEDGNPETESPGWGIAMNGGKGQTYLLRFEMK